MTCRFLLCSSKSNVCKESYKQHWFALQLVVYASPMGILVVEFSKVYCKLLCCVFVGFLKGVQLFLLYKVMLHIQCRVQRDQLVRRKFLLTLLDLVCFYLSGFWLSWRSGFLGIHLKQSSENPKERCH